LSATPPWISFTAKTYTAPSFDEYLLKRLMPVEGMIPHLEGIEMYGNSIPAGAVGGDLRVGIIQRLVIGICISLFLR
jgi:hypothetical protein